jgi:P-type E1-E2 ATPase
VPSGVEWRTNRTTFIEGWLTFLVLYNNFIPISMYVTLEVMTYFQMFYINEDREMYHEESDTPAKARSNIVTDLGQIEYVFSDKTGTLTQNVMRFKRCAVNSRIYGAPILITDANANVPYVNLSQVRGAYVLRSWGV